MTAPALPRVLDIRFTEAGQPYACCPQCPCEILVENQDCQAAADVLAVHTAQFHA